MCVEMAEVADVWVAISGRKTTYERERNTTVKDSWGHSYGYEHKDGPKGYSISANGR